MKKKCDLSDVECGLVGTWTRLTIIENADVLGFSHLSFLSRTARLTETETVTITICYNQDLQDMLNLEADGYSSNMSFNMTL